MQKWSLIFVLLCFLVTALCGGSKLYLQKRNPPDFAVRQGQIFDGYVSIDFYCHRAAKVKRALTGQSDPNLTESLARKDILHPTSWLVPVAVALVSSITASIPVAFFVLSLSALFAQAWLIRLLVFEICGHAALLFANCAAVVFLSHITTIRSAGQFYLDPFVSTAALAAVLLTFRILRSPAKKVAGLGLAALQASALFLKSSYLPWLAAPALLAFVGCKEGRLATTLRFGLLYGVLPLVPALIFLNVAHGELQSATKDMADLASSWTLSSGELKRFALEMVLLFQWLPLAFVFTLRPRDSRILGLLLCLALVLLSVWSFRLPAIARLYLPVLSVLVAACFAHLAGRVSERAVIAMVVVHAAINYAFAAYVLLHHV